MRRAGHSADDGYRHPLVRGVKSSQTAARLAEEIAWAASRLVALGAAPPGLYAEIATGEDVEEAAWLAFLVAYISPLDGGEPFRAISEARTSWSSGEPPELGGTALGPRTSHDPERGARTLAAYRAWAARAGSQSAALAGSPEWTPERRFARAYERLSLPGLRRDARYEVLVLLGRLGVCELRAGDLALGGDDVTTVAAKRVFGIGDKLLLERRAGELAAACAVPLEALDAALFNWAGDGPRATLGCAEVETVPELGAQCRDALGL